MAARWSDDTRGQELGVGRKAGSTDRCRNKGQNGLYWRIAQMRTRVLRWSSWWKSQMSRRGGRGRASGRPCPATFHLVATGLMRLFAGFCRKCVCDSDARTFGMGSCCCWVSTPEGRLAVGGVLLSVWSMLTVGWVAGVWG
ncbi:hypothetical protein M011DRAFT_54404 [Sporormia fimetaria CBS 119925]|uniref:Uncharacterized protein n=1 Tax=Sporormia fimetaria CBS 119925 TaxID=1340428 RepID=A0A6A6V9S4_9PLEO|nr:hypothetical protein M011DRAFT_54404 [Sporormia fimetaria CBS 119925]